MEFGQLCLIETLFFSPLHLSPSPPSPIMLILSTCQQVPSFLCVQGEELVNYLQKDYLPTLHLSAEQSQEFCQALQTDPKTFKAYLKVRTAAACGLFL